MRLTTATGCFWYRPFDETLRIIRSAGGAHIEADLYWQRAQWERGQHLKDISGARGREMTWGAGLSPSNVHNVGGLSMSADEDAVTVFDETVFEWLDPSIELQCLVFHVPHIMKAGTRPGWWDAFEPEWVQGISRYKRPDTIVAIENLQPVEECDFPLFELVDLMAFAERHDLWINLDTTQCVWAGFDPYEAASMLAPRIVSAHLSQFTNAVPHTHVAEGDIEWGRFFACLAEAPLVSATIECTMTTAERRDVDMGDAELTDRLADALEIIGRAASEETDHAVSTSSPIARSVPEDAKPRATLRTLV